MQTLQEELTEHEAAMWKLLKEGGPRWKNVSISRFRGNNNEKIVIRAYKNEKNRREINTIVLVDEVELRKDQFTTEVDAAHLHNAVPFRLRVHISDPTNFLCIVTV